MTIEQASRIAVVIAILAVAALIGGYLGLIFGGFTEHALTITV